MEGQFRIPDDLVRGPSTSDILGMAGEKNWGMKRFDVDRLRSVADGTGIIVGIIDTGIDSNHPEFAGGKLIGSKDFTNSGSGSNDRNGHGTHVSGTVGANNPEIGVATGAKLVHGKGLSDGGSGGGNGIAAAMRWCVEQGATVLSMSIGSSDPDPNINEAGLEVTSKGVWVCCAAGNSGGGTQNIDYPGRFPWAISVAALDSNLDPASFTSAGAGIRTSAPGVGIWSARPASLGGGYQAMGGTSMATPFVAGVLACYRSGLLKFNRPIPTTAEIQTLMESDAMDVGLPGVDRRSGPGALWPLLLANNLVPDPFPIRP